MAAPVQKWIASKEGQRLEFRLSLSRPDRLARAVAAFANQPGGGRLLAGVTDDGRIVGLRGDLRRYGSRQALRRELLAGLRPLVQPWPAVRMRFHRVEGIDVAVIQVRHSPRPCHCEDRAYIRDGPTTRVATPEELGRVRRRARNRRIWTWAKRGLLTLWVGFLLLVLLLALFLAELSRQQWVIVPGSWEATLAVRSRPFGAHYHPDGEHLLFHVQQAQHSVGWHIYRVGRDGQGQRQLTASATNEFLGDISPDGKTLVFTHVRDQNARIYTLPLEEALKDPLPLERWELLLPGPEASCQGESPSYSRDGRYLVFQSNCNLPAGNLQQWKNSDLAIAETGTDYDLYILDLRSQEIWPITSGEQDELWPSFSPDGRQVVYTQQIDWKNQRLRLLDLVSGEDRLLSPPREGLQERHPLFSPDGHWILFSSNRDGSQEIYVMPSPGRADTESGAVRCLSFFGGFEPAFSPDGQTIAFSSTFRQSNTQIYEAPFDPAGISGHWQYHVLAVLRRGVARFLGWLVPWP